MQDGLPFDDWGRFSPESFIVLVVDCRP